MTRHTLNVNGQARPLEVESDTPLLWALRDELGLVGTKHGCGAGLCGACTVHVDGQAQRSCQLPVSALKGTARITTIEGLGGDHPLQRAWVEHDVAQCGYCQAGQIMQAAALLKANPKPTDAEIDAAMAGNLCRCGTYPRIRAAIKAAAEMKPPAQVGGAERVPTWSTPPGGVAAWGVEPPAATGGPAWERPGARPQSPLVSGTAGSPSPQATEVKA